MPKPPDNPDDFAGLNLRLGPWELPYRLHPNDAAALAAYGKSLSDMGHGFAQHVLNPLWHGVTGHDVVSQEDIDAASRRDQPLMAHPGAKFGYMAGNVINTLPAGVAAATMLPEAVGVGGLSALARYGLPAMHGAAAGAAQSALAQPTYSGETMAGNVGEAAALGGLGQASGSMAGGMLKPARDLIMDPTRRALVAAADRTGIPLRRSQILGSSNWLDDWLSRLPFSGRAATDTAQRTAYSTAINKTFGQADQPDVGLAVQNAQKALGDTYKQLAQGEKLLVSQGDVAAMDQHIGNYAQGAPDENGLKALRTWRDNFMNRYAATGGNGIDGAQYQNMRSTLNNKAQSLKQADPDQSKAWGNLRDTLDNAMMMRLPPDKQAVWQATNQAWATMRAVEPSIPKTMPTGTDPALADPGTVARNLRSTKPKNQFLASQMNQPGPTGVPAADVAKVGERLVGRSEPRVSHIGDVISGAGPLGAGYLAYHELEGERTGNVPSGQSNTFLEEHPWLGAMGAAALTGVAGGTLSRYANTPEAAMNWGSAGAGTRHGLSWLNDYLLARNLPGSVLRSAGTLSKAAVPPGALPGPAAAAQQPPAAGAGAMPALPPGVEVDESHPIPAELLR
jgi:hypothetical protein